MTLNIPGILVIDIYNNKYVLYSDVQEYVSRILQGREHDLETKVEKACDDSWEKNR